MANDFKYIQIMTIENFNKFSLYTIKNTIQIAMKKLLLFIVLIGLFSCTCLPQIPPQYLPADNNCEAILPNYLQYINVRDNCGNATLTQEPLPGTILDADNPYFRVKITATDLSGNTDVEKFDVFLWDTIPPVIIWDSIPGDTLVYRRNDIDLLIDSYVAVRKAKGDTTSNNFRLWFTR